jgi:hypothetical protein
VNNSAFVHSNKIGFILNELPFFSSVPGTVCR